jgi:hypothetical protein
MMKWRRSEANDFDALFPNSFFILSFPSALVGAVWQQDELGREWTQCLSGETSFLISDLS